MSEFEKEFEMLQQHGWRRMPFGQIFQDESLRKIFEDEFEKAPYKFSDRKFIEAPLKLSDDRKLINADSDLKESDMRDALDEARFSYDSNKEINRLAKYEVHDIQQTIIYKMLKKIGQMLENFKTMQNVNPENLIEVAQETGSAIHREIRRFDSEPLREAIIKAIIDNDNNDVLIWSGKVNEADYRQFKMYLNNYLCKLQSEQKCLDLLENQLQKPSKGNVVDNISRGALAMFCVMVERSGVIENNETSDEKFCKLVLKKYSFSYTDKIRQEFGNIQSNMHSWPQSGETHRTWISEMEKEILAKIPTPEANLIKDYLTNLKKAS